MNDNFEINIAQIYPELLNEYGDKGNITALIKRLQWRNIKVNFEKICTNTDINFSKYDICCILGGEEKQQIEASKHLNEHKSNLIENVNNGMVMLATGGGFNLCGKYYHNKNGEKIDGLEIFDSYSVFTEKRLTGNVTIKTDFLKDNFVVGFENHNCYTYLEKNTKPLGEVIVGYGNNLSDKQEGARKYNVFGTNLHGALLPKNPKFCDYLIELAIRRKLNDNSFTLSQINDIIENDTHKKLIKKAY